MLPLSTHWRPAVARRAVVPPERCQERLRLGFQRFRDETTETPLDRSSRQMIAEPRLGRTASDRYGRRSQFSLAARPRSQNKAASPMGRRPADPSAKRQPSAAGNTGLTVHSPRTWAQQDHLAPALCARPPPPSRQRLAPVDCNGPVAAVGLQQAAPIRRNRKASSALTTAAAPRRVTVAGTNPGGVPCPADLPTSAASPCRSCAKRYSGNAVLVVRTMSSAERARRLACSGRSWASSRSDGCSLCGGPCRQRFTRSAQRRTR